MFIKGDRLKIGGCSVEGVEFHRMVSKNLEKMGSLCGFPLSSSIQVASLIANLGSFKLSKALNAAVHLLP